MGVTIQQWRAAIGRPAPHLKVEKEDEDHIDIGEEIGDNGRRLLSRILVNILWLLLAHWVMTFIVNEDVTPLYVGWEQYSSCECRTYSWTRGSSVASGFLRPFGPVSGLNFARGLSVLT